MIQKHQDGSVTFSKDEVDGLIKMAELFQVEIKRQEALKMAARRAAIRPRYDWIDHACGLSLIDKMLGR
jgi:hypothetical protein